MAHGSYFARTAGLKSWMKILITLLLLTGDLHAQFLINPYVFASPGTSPGTPAEYWDMQEGAGDRVGEISSTIMTGAAVGNSASGLYGNCAEWNTTADLIAIVSAYTTGGDVALNFWFRIPSPSGLDIPQFFYETGATLGDALDFEQWNGVDGTSGAYSYADGDVFRDITAGYGDAQTSNWRMVSISYNGVSGILSFYLDGSLVGTTASAVVLGSRATPRIRINGYNGMETVRVDEIYFKYGTFTSANVTWMWNAGAGRQFSDF